MKSWLPSFFLSHSPLRGCSARRVRYTITNIADGLWPIAEPYGINSAVRFVGGPVTIPISRGFISLE